LKNKIIFEAAQKAARKLALFEVQLINQILHKLSEKTIAQIPFLLAENQKDLDRMEKTNPKYDRLLLSETRLRSIAQDLVSVSTLDYPVGKILEHKSLENGLEIEKISVPLGVVGIIYEARPNVTFDCFALCLKSGNAVILKGGSDAQASNEAILKIIHEVLIELDVDTHFVQLLPSDRDSTTELLNAVQYIDVIIPRGSQSLIDYVRANAKVPVIETGAGVVHVYFDEFGDVENGGNIIFNSKTRRVSVCNALDCLLIHQSRLKDLAAIILPLAKKQVIIYADEHSFEVLKNHYPDELLLKANEKAFGTEFLDYKMAIKTVDSLDEALNHLAVYSSKHSECIVTENENNKNKFLKTVDAAAVYANASTAFTDGGLFGMGAEIGISTQKLHARGPMALPELTSYKWIVRGNGQVRS
jgi:glutamate-5-semialdehyde dehydrogenase